jgi:hypothetical protein
MAAGTSGYPHGAAAAGGHTQQGTGTWRSSRYHRAAWRVLSVGWGSRHCFITWSPAGVMAQRCVVAPWLQARRAVSAAATRTGRRRRSRTSSATAATAPTSGSSADLLRTLGGRRAAWSLTETRRGGGIDHRALLGPGGRWLYPRSEKGGEGASLVHNPRGTAKEGREGSWYGASGTGLWEARCIGGSDVAYDCRSAVGWGHRGSDYGISEYKELVGPQMPPNGPSGRGIALLGHHPIRWLYMTRPQHAAMGRDLQGLPSRARGLRARCA